MKRDNPYHSTPMDYPFSAEETGALAGVQQALEHEVDELVRLELVAEQMLVEEVDLAKAYLEDDSQHVWADLREGLQRWEVVAGEWLLSAADPSRVNWQLNHWWGDDEVHLH